ncbi:stage II sporulation protein P [Thermohalobacter berrensis]|nr:stage II sporulation protein P [Thermohalobacter berrensis]
MKNRCIILALIFIILTINYVEADDWYLNGKSYFTVYDMKSKKKLFLTAWQVNIGDKYHSEDNKLYEIIKVEKGNIAYAKCLKDIKMPDISNVLEETVFKQEDVKKVGIYFTHTDESYIPTSGTASEWGNGDIIAVGKNFTNNLEKQGITVILNKTRHDPHDAASYKRSRRTVFRMLLKQPDALFDLHRDGVPKEEYITELNGETVSRIRIVLGRRNPNLMVNEELALYIKAIADELYPGLVKDIYYGRGNYNQDLTPKSLLLEMGTYTLSQSQVNKSNKYLAEIIKKAVFGGLVGTREVKGVQKSNKGAYKGLVTIIFFVSLGSLLFLFISSSKKERKAKIEDIINRLLKFLNIRH